jgi:hypothetical protein
LTFLGHLMAGCLTVNQRMGVQFPPEEQNVRSGALALMVKALVCKTEESGSIPGRTSYRRHPPMEGERVLNSPVGVQLPVASCSPGGLLAVDSGLSSRGRGFDSLPGQAVSGAAWERICFGSRGSRVRIPPHRQRRVAQPGSAPGSGPGGQRFESAHADFIGS